MNTLINLAILASNFYYGSQDKAISKMQNKTIKLPIEIMELITKFSDLKTLKSFNLTNKELNLITEKNKDYAQNKCIQNFAKQIVSEFEPKIKIVQFYLRPSPNSYAAWELLDKKATKECKGLLTIKLNENSGVNIDYNGDWAAIPQSRLNEKSNPLDSHSNECRFTSKAEVNSFSNSPIEGNDLEKRAASIAQKQIDSLLETNVTKARNLIA